MDSGLASGLPVFLLVGGLLLGALGLSRRRSSGAGSYEPGQSRTRTGVVMGQIYDPAHFRYVDFVVSDEGQNRPEIIVVNQSVDSNLLLIESQDGLTVLELGPENERHGHTAPLD